MGKKMPASLLTTVEKAVKTITLLRVTQPKRAETLRQAVAAVLADYMQPDTRVKLRYLSRDVRFQGIWRGWREAGLEHLSDEALTRFCGFPKESRVWAGEAHGHGPQDGRAVPRQQVVDPHRPAHAARVRRA